MDIVHSFLIKIDKMMYRYSSNYNSIDITLILTTRGVLSEESDSKKCNKTENSSHSPHVTYPNDPIKTERV